MKEKSNDLSRSQIYTRMSPAKKWEEVCRLKEAAWKLKTARIRFLHPDWSEEAIQEEVRKIFLYAVT